MVHIRPATEADFPTLLQVQQAAFESTPTSIL